MVWGGSVCYGMVWYSMLWYGMVCFGEEEHGGTYGIASHKCPDTAGGGAGRRKVELVVELGLPSGPGPVGARSLSGREERPVLEGPGRRRR